MISIHTCCPGKNFPTDNDSFPAPKIASAPSQVKPSIRQLDMSLPFLIE
jgi:hypothetical protein